MGRKKSLRGLGITLEGKKVYLLCHFFHGQEANFQVNTSPDGLNFSPETDQLKIITKKNQKEDIRSCRDFRIAKVNKKHYFLTYLKRQLPKNQDCLYGCLSRDLIRWIRITKISQIKEAGMVVPNYDYQGKFVLYFGGRSIKIAFSEDLDNWKIYSKPVLSLTKNSPSNSRIKVGNLLLLKRGILLLYFEWQSLKGSKNYFIKSALFDKKEPRKLLRQSEQPIWRMPKDWEDKSINPIGIIRLNGKLVSYWEIEGEGIFAVSHPVFRSKFKPRLTPLLKKFKKNPILSPIFDHFWESQYVFNPAAVYEGGKVHLVYRAVGDKAISVFGYASSGDGFHIDERLKKPIYTPQEPFESTPQAPDFHPLSYISGWGCGGCEDPRITKIDDRFYMTYVAWDGRNLPRVALTSISVDDFLNHRWSWEKPVLISPPGELHKNWAVFPEKINGKYAILHSISPKVLIAYVDSLKFDGSTYINSHYYGGGASRKNCWDNWVKGAGPPPIKTKDGWLLFYHAMDSYDPGRYKLGAMILDFKDPSGVVYRSKNPILEPDECYENEGFKPGVTYACGAVLVNNRLFVYYGGADTVVCGASANSGEFLHQLKYAETAKLRPVVVA